MTAWENKFTAIPVYSRSRTGCPPRPFRSGYELPPPMERLRWQEKAIEWIEYLLKPTLLCKFGVGVPGRGIPTRQHSAFALMVTVFFSGVKPAP